MAFQNGTLPEAVRAAQRTDRSEYPCNPLTPPAPFRADRCPMKSPMAGRDNKESKMKKIFNDENLHCRSTRELEGLQCQIRKDIAVREHRRREADAACARLTALRARLAAPRP